LNRLSDQLLNSLEEISWLREYIKDAKQQIDLEQPVQASLLLEKAMNIKIT